jgi:hypothetical protein
MGHSWVIPDKAGDYEIRAFFISCLQCKGIILAQVTTHEVTALD